MPGNPYADMQPAPQVAAPPGQGLGVASICLGIIGLILCASGLFSGVYPAFSAKDSVEQALAPFSFIAISGTIFILGSNGRKRVQDPRHERMYKVGVWMNAAPMIVFLVAEITAILWLMGGLIYPGRLWPIALDK